MDDAPRSACCDLCGRPTLTSHLTGQWTAGAVVPAGFIGREMVVKRLLFICQSCPIIGDIDGPRHA